MDDLGNRMKQYENVNRNFLMGRMPVIIRIDGCHFHAYTKGLNKPFDEDLTHIMWETAKYLCKNIMGCKLAYHQSDEISLLLTNYDKLTTQSWFTNNIQKIVSVAASMATAKFNELSRSVFPDKPLATFDGRVFVLPKNEVCNYFHWRQKDASKNSVSMVAQSNFSHKSLQGLKTGQLQEKLFNEAEINWNSLPTWQKRGICVIKEEYVKVNESMKESIRTRWIVDHETPEFTKDRNYIEKFVFLQN